MVENPNPDKPRRDPPNDVNTSGQLLFRLSLCAICGFLGGLVAFASWHHGIPILGSDAYGTPKPGFDFVKAAVFGALGAISALFAIFVIVAPDPDDYPRLIALSAAAGIFFLPVINSSADAFTDPEKEVVTEQTQRAITKAEVAVRSDATSEDKTAAINEFVVAVDAIGGLQASGDPELQIYSRTNFRNLLTNPAVRELLREESTGVAVPEFGPTENWWQNSVESNGVPSWVVPLEVDPSNPAGSQFSFPSPNSNFCVLFPEGCSG
jgi:hypothetical protein